MNKTRNLLIVDDNRLNVDLLEETLRPFEFNIMSYDSPIKALEDSKDKQFELALLDVVMPDMNGFELAAQFLEHHPNTPVIFVSAHGTNENKIKGFNLGSYAYIEKPFDIKTIRAQVSSILKIKSLQDELFAEKEKLDNIFAFASDEIIMTDLDFNITSKNHRIFIGGEREHLNFIDVLEKYKQTEIRKLIKVFIDAHEKHITFQMTLDEVIADIKISKIFDKKSKTTGYLIIIRDVTQEVQRISQKEQFIATLTHDLKTPIRAESRALELLLGGSFGALTDEQESIIKEIYNSSRFMAHMTDNLLTRYKIDRKEVSLHKDINSFKKTVQKCADNLKYLLKEKNQLLKINIDLEEDSFLYDELEIIRVIHNLLTNASEYSGGNSEIAIHVTKNEDFVEASVSDNGAGICEKDLPTVFNEHASSAKKFKKVGSGLGLFISRKIIEAHGGKISVKSVPGEGTSFTFTVPFCMASDKISN